MNPRATARCDATGLRPGRLAARGPLISILLAIVFVVIASGTARAGFMDEFIDPTDGQFDVGHWLLNKRGVLLNPMIITQPAVGYGGGATALYFHKNEADAERARQGEVLGLPPGISFAMGLGTQNGTWATGGGHFASWKQDRIRYLGAVGYASMNLDFYVANAPLGYNLEGVFVVQQINFRVLRSPVFLGARYVYSHLDSTFDVPPAVASRLPTSRTDDLGGLGIDLMWDTRNNLLDPSDGEYVQILPMFFGRWMGGDDTYQSLDIDAQSFNRIYERFDLDFHVGADLSFGDTPFYALPRVNLRGVSATRYQGPYAGEVEFESRWRFWKRWSLVGFFGLGWVAGGTLPFETSDGVVPAGGGGFRYLIARQLGLNMGMDFAGSENQFAFYFQVGTAWR